MEIIHIVIGKANPNRMNGVNKVVYQLATRQYLSHRSVQVWGLSNSESISHRPVFKLKLFKRIGVLGQVDKSLLKQLSSLTKDAVVHFHGSWIIDFAILAKVLRKRKITYVTTPHGGYNRIAMNKSKLKKRLYFQLFERGFVNNARKVHSIGVSEEEGLKRITQVANSYCTPYGFDLDSFAVNDDKEKGFVYCYMGRLDSYTKGLDLLIDAFSVIHQQSPEAQLWLIGNGPSMDSLKQEVKAKGLLSAVKFLGAQFGQAKFDLMSKSHVFMHPSRNEGLPSAILEAAAINLPTIATEATNVGGFIRKFDGGWTVKNNSVLELTLAMKSAINSSKIALSKKGNNARAMLLEVFDWKKILVNFDKLYLK